MMSPTRALDATEPLAFDGGALDPIGGGGALVGVSTEEFPSG
ncbi:hypothetical protein [Nocardia sp. NBC_00403]